ncbi:MAG TPA: DUF2069 domain-containing protein [Oleiagrimonas sp.]|nr:DUF2069 domain-containing protein [Oleiagrimonas sp.]
MTATLPGRVRRAHRIGYAAWALLAAWQIVWHAWWYPPAQSPALASAVALIPLLLPLLAIKRPARALLWAGIIALFYFCHGVSVAWTVPPERVPALLETLLSVTLILALGAGVQKRTPAAKTEKP